MTDAQTSAPLQPIGILRRLACIIYESMLLLAVLMLTALGATLLTGINEEHPLFPLFTLFTLCVAFLYFGWFWTRGGVSLAMQTWRIQLVGRRGQAVTWMHAMRRFLVALLQWVVILVGLQAWRTGLWPVALGVLVVVAAGLVWTWRHPQKLMLHDLLSDTRLVRLPDHKKTGV
ncbi:RDD domain containing protein [Ectothiorhodospira sp. PHS-1]|uniref:RDD family protein n=1 Tax=Ectothiorhodospira sp. PHS-1 TaxID=519989 RepID=UPI00024A810E|nr:RDD family protein [Ectothiorhodospira sp. PHS-1]EHQ52016.1 RDD domain containing protein [Ectothiorhodospira sp. PHS-1]